MKEKVAPIFLLVLGSLGMLGHILGLPALRGIGAMTCASPAPKVFSAVRGLETYSTNFRIEWIDHAGTPQSVLITSERYARIQGPYNRRNVYGAALAFGPILATDEKTKAMHASVMRYAACGDRPLLAELGIDPAQVAGKLQVVLEPLPGTDLGELPAILEVPCR